MSIMTEGSSVETSFAFRGLGPCLLPNVCAGEEIGNQVGFGLNLTLQCCSRILGLDK